MAKGQGQVMAAGFAHLQPVPNGKIHCPLCGSELQFDAMGGWFCYGSQPDEPSSRCDAQSRINEQFGDPERVQGQTFGFYVVGGVKVAECWAVRNRGPYWHTKISPVDCAFLDRELPERMQGGEWKMILEEK